MDWIRSGFMLWNHSRSLLYLCSRFMGCFCRMGSIRQTGASRFKAILETQFCKGRVMLSPLIFHTLFKIHLTTPQTVNSLSGDISIILYFGLAGTYQIGPGSMRTRFNVNGNNSARSISSGSIGKTKRRRKYSNKPEE